MKRQSKILYSPTKAKKSIYYTSWTDFVFDIQEGKVGNKHKNIFRGQSNFNFSKPEIWDIKSSFNRAFNGTNFLKNKYAEYGNIRNYLKIYKTASTENLPEVITFCDVLQFFQHYSIPTPLIDFTSDPLIALYFSLSAVPSYSSGHFGDKRKRHLTITEIDLDEFEKYFSISEMDKVETLLNHKIDTTKDDYPKVIKKLQSDYNKCLKPKGFVIDFFLEPNIQINPNLFRQKGVFLYLDSNESFESLLELNIKNNKIKPSKPILIKHNIPYEKCFTTPANNCLNIFSYLQFKQKTGVYLFENDIQGLKYDLLNGNFTYPLECLGRIKDCDCRKILIANKIIV
jgi:hypothetical protein